MTLAAFLEAFFGLLHAKGIGFCVLRNYAGLPATNVGADIDLLISPQDLDRALGVLASVQGIMITDVAQRPYVLNSFVQGIDSGCLQIDLVISLSWRGIDYLDVSEVLGRARSHPSCSWIPIPDPVDEAIISFFSSFAIGGFIKDRYAPSYLPVFREAAPIAEARIDGRIAPAVLRRLFASIADGRQDEALGMLGQVRRSMLFRAVARKPLTTAFGLIRHYWAEVSIHFAASNLCRVALFGPDGAGKSAVLKGLEPRLKHCSKIIQIRHLRPRLPGIERPTGDSGPVLDPHGKPAKSSVKSHLQLIVWLAAYWWDRLMRRKRNATLQIYDRYFHDVLVDPKRYRYGGSKTFARLLSKLVPRFDLVVFLDAPPEVLQSRKREVPPEETARQRQAYLDLARTLPNAHVVDASRPLSEVVAEVEKIVLKYMAERTARRLGLRDA